MAKKISVRGGKGRKGRTGHKGSRRPSSRNPRAGILIVGMVDSDANLQERCLFFRKRQQGKSSADVIGTDLTKVAQTLDRHGELYQVVAFLDDGSENTGKRIAHFRKMANSRGWTGLKLLGVPDPDREKAAKRREELQSLGCDLVVTPEALGKAIHTAALNGGRVYKVLQAGEEVATTSP